MVKEISIQQELAAARKGTTERYFNKKKSSTGSKTRKVPVEALTRTEYRPLSQGKGATTLESTWLLALKVAKAQAL